MRSNSQKLAFWWSCGYEESYFRWVFRFWGNKEAMDTVIWLARMERESRQTQDWII